MKEGFGASMNSLIVNRLRRLKASDIASALWKYESDASGPQQFPASPPTRIAACPQVFYHNYPSSILIDSFKHLTASRDTSAHAASGVRILRFICAHDGGVHGVLHRILIPNEVHERILVFSFGLVGGLYMAPKSRRGLGEHGSNFFIFPIFFFPNLDEAGPVLVSVFTFVQPLQSGRG